MEMHAFFMLMLQPLLQNLNEQVNAGKFQMISSNRSLLWEAAFFFIDFSGAKFLLKDLQADKRIYFPSTKMYWAQNYWKQRLNQYEQIEEMKPAAAQLVCHFINFWWHRHVFLLAVEEKTK